MAPSNTTTASSSSNNGPSSTSNTSASIGTGAGPTSSLRVAEARQALEASMTNIGTSMTAELSARAQNLHTNSKALDKQQTQLEKETAKLKKENDKLNKEAERGAKVLKELGNVQNWAEILERDFLVLRETLRLAREGSDGSEYSESSSGNWTEEDEVDRRMEVLVENWEEDVEGDGLEGITAGTGTAAIGGPDPDIDIARSTEPCKLCADGERDGQVLLCDGCAAAYHAQCLGMNIAPEGTWFCSICKGKGRDEADQSIDQVRDMLLKSQLEGTSEEHIHDSTRVTIPEEHTETSKDLQQHEPHRPQEEPQISQTLQAMTHVDKEQRKKSKELQGWTIPGVQQRSADYENGQGIFNFGGFEAESSNGPKQGSYEKGSPTSNPFLYQAVTSPATNSRSQDSESGIVRDSERTKEIG